MNIRFKKFVTGLSMAGAMALGFAIPAIALDGVPRVDYSEDYATMGSVSEMYLTYHSRVDDLFNDAIERVFNGEGYVEVAPGDDLAAQHELCTDANNIAAICLAIKQQYEFRGYEEALQYAKRSSLPMFDEEDKNYDILHRTFKEGDKAAFIAEELGFVETADEFAIPGETVSGTAARGFDITLDYYQEFLSSYTIHKKYEELYDTVNAYNLKMEVLNQGINQWPGRFHNATTTGGECT